MGADQAELVPHDQHARLHAHHLGGLVQDQLHETRVLLRFRREPLRLGGRNDARQRHLAALGLGDDLLRHGKDVAVLQGQVVARQRIAQDGGQIVACLDQLDAGQRRDVEADHGTRSAWDR